MILWYPTDRPRHGLGIRDQLGQLGSIRFHDEDAIQAITGNPLFIGGEASEQAPRLDVRQLSHLAAVYGDGPPIRGDIAVGFRYLHAHESIEPVRPVGLSWDIGAKDE